MGAVGTSEFQFDALRVSCPAFSDSSTSVATPHTVPYSSDECASALCYTDPYVLMHTVSDAPHALSAVSTPGDDLT